MIVLIDGVRYELITPENEAWLEKQIQSNCEHIFGPDSFYFDIKKLIKSKAGVASIPDGYVVFFAPKSRWAVVEVELASHSVYGHLVPQLSKFNKGIEDSTTRKQLADALYRAFDDDEVLRARLKQKIRTGEVYKFISDLVSQDPLTVVAIDRKTEELAEAVEDIKGDVRVLEFWTFRREGGTEDVNAFVFEPLSKKSGNGPRPQDTSKSWDPVRRGSGPFSGKPTPVRDEGWVAKSVRGIEIALKLRSHKCSVVVTFKGDDREDRRKQALGLLPKVKYEYGLYETPKVARVQFPVLDKGKEDHSDWPEIREKLVGLGTDIYNRISKADV